MARGFGATLGSGSTDRVVSSYSTYSAQFSVGIWAYRNGGGGNNRGRYVECDAFRFYYNNATATRIESTHTTNGLWDIPIQGTGAWNFNGFSHDQSSTSNDPVGYRDTTKYTVGSGMTEVVAPSGTQPSSFANLMVGNRFNGGLYDRNWDGYHAEFALWNAILTDSEFLALASGASPLLVRPQNLVEYIPMVRDNISRKVAAPTITGTAVQPHPRIYLPHRRRSVFVPAGDTTVSPGKATLRFNPKAVTISTAASDTTVGPINKAALRFNMKAVNTNSKREFTKAALRFNGKSLSTHKVQEVTKAALRFSGKGVTTGGAIVLGKAALRFAGKAVNANAIRAVTKGAARFSAKAVQIAAPLFISIGKAALRFSGRAVTVAGGALRAITVSTSRMPGPWKSLVARIGGVGSGGVNAQEEP